MFTVCPKCSLKLAVTAADLRVAQGYVRCGRCANVFNALAGLSDEQQAALARQEALSPAPLKTESAAADAPAAEAAPANEQAPANALAAPATATPGRSGEAPVGANPRAGATSGPAKASQPTAAAASATARTPSTAAPRPASAPSPSAPATARAPSGAAAAPAKVVGGAAARPDAVQPTPPRAPAGAPSTTPARASASAASATAAAQGPRAPPSPPRPATPPPPAPAATQAEESSGDFSLEFDPSSTDVNAVFVELRPDANDPSGTFESIILSSEEAEDESEPAEVVEFEFVDAQKPGGAETKVADVPAEPAEPESREPQSREPGTPTDGVHAPETSAADPIRQSEAARRFETARQLELTRQGERAPEQASRPETTRAAPEKPEAGRLEVGPAILDIGQLPPALSIPQRLSGAFERPNRPLLLGSVALAALLAVQVVHHFRNDLQDTWLGRPLSVIYGVFGMPLAPRADVNAYEVRQLGAYAGQVGKGELTVRASIKNTTPDPQPLPILRVTVQDRFGNRVAARDVPPPDYRPGASAADFLAPGERTDAEIAFVDPGTNVVGFDIDACLKDPAGRVVCASDVSASR